MASTLQEKFQTCQQDCHNVHFKIKVQVGYLHQSRMAVVALCLEK